MNRPLLVGVALGGLALVVLAVLLVDTSPSPGDAPTQAPNEPTRAGPVAPAPAPRAVRPAPEHRIALSTSRTREEGLPKRRLADLEDPKEIHRQAITEIQKKVLQPCVPRPSLRQENVTRRLEVDYVLQPTGIVEVQVRGVDAERQEMDVDGKLLDCFASKVGGLEGPGVTGEVHHRFVFAYRTPEPEP